MLEHRRPYYQRAGSLLLLLVCGCSLPSWFTGPDGLHPADSVSRWHGTSSSVPPSSIQHSEASPLPLPHNPPMNEQIALMSQRVAGLDDDRKVLAARLQLVETQLDEKEKALALATREIQESTAQIARARNELQQWKKDMKVLRDRLGSMERDNREALEAMIKTLEQVLDRDREQQKGADLPQLEALPLPKLP